MKLFELLVIAGLLATCGGGRTRLNPGHTGASSHGGRDADLGGPGSIGADDAGVCPGGCATPPGPAKVYPSLDELAAALVGEWAICFGGHALFTGAPSDTLGVEFGPSSSTGNGSWRGNLYFLKRGPSGPVRGEGQNYQQTYAVVDDRTVSCWSPDFKDSTSFELMYSPCPRAWWFWGLNSRQGTLAPF
jgi:hypothetical protein